MPPRHHALAVALVLVLGGCQAADPESPDETVRPATPGPVATATEGATTSPTPTPTPAGPRPAAAMADATSCADLAALVVDGLQDHVDAYASTTPEGIAQVSVARAALLEELATSAGEAASRLGCAGSDYRDLLATELDRLEAVSGVQRAVAGTFVSGLLGGDDPSDPGPSTIQVSTADELAQAMIAAGSGSTIEVAAGTYELDTSLVALRPLTVVGAGAEDTTITSTATGAALVIGTAGTVAITGATLSATAPGASVVAVTRGGLDLDAVTIAGATRDDAGAGGFGLVLAPDGSTGTGRHAVTASTFRDNDGGAILVDGIITPLFRGLEVEATTGCGICWIGTTGGVLEDTTITGGETALRVEADAAPTIRATTVTDAATGMVVLDTARPLVSDTTIEGAEAAIEVGGSAMPELTRVSLVDSIDVGLRMAGTSAAIVDDVAITGSGPGGIGVLEQATPTITGGTIDLDGEVAVLFGNSAGGTIDGTTITGARIGLQIGGQADPTVTGVTATGIGDAAFLVVDEGSAVMSGLTCDDDASGIVGLQTSGDYDVQEVDCEVVEATEQGDDES